jgi:hypothetical protein
MKKELKKAINDSIKHWEEDIIKPLREGDKILINYDRERIWENAKTKVKCYSGYCPLCDLIGSEDCCGCPLDDLQMCCENFNSPWNKFIIKPCLSTAKNMVKALQKCLEIK